MPPPKLELAFTLRGFFAKDHMLDVKTVKGGPQRTVAPIASGFMKGDGLEAEVVPGGGDWLLINVEDNTAPCAHIDTRLNLRTDQGHSIFVRYEGVLNVDSKCHDKLTGSRAAKTTEFGDHEWFVNPIMETSDPELKWIESTVFLAEGRWVVEDGEIGIEYLVYRVKPSK